MPGPARAGKGGVAGGGWWGQTFINGWPHLRKSFSQEKKA